MVICLSARCGQPKTIKEFHGQGKATPSDFHKIKNTVTQASQRPAHTHITQPIRTQLNTNKNNRNIQSMCVETTNRHLESQFGLTITFSILVLLPSRVRILGWMGPTGQCGPIATSRWGWTAQWSVCRAGGAAGPHWPHSPMLHGYRGLYGSPRTAWWTAPTWVVTRGGRAANHAVAHLAGGDAKYIWLIRQ